MKQTDILTQAVWEPRAGSGPSLNSTIVDTEILSGCIEILIDGAEVSKEAMIIDPCHSIDQGIAQANEVI